MEQIPQIPGLLEMEAIFEKEADGTITRWESNILIEWTDKYDKNWEIADKKIAGYKERIKECGHIAHINKCTTIYVVIRPSVSQLFRKTKRIIYVSPDGNIYYDEKFNVAL